MGGGLDAVASSIQEFTNLAWSLSHVPSVRARSTLASWLQEQLCMSPSTAQHIANELRGLSRRLALSEVTARASGDDFRQQLCDFGQQHIANTVWRSGKRAKRCILPMRLCHRSAFIYPVPWAP